MNINLDFKSSIELSDISYHNSRNFNNYKRYEFDKILKVDSRLLPKEFTPRCCHRSVFIDPFIILFAGEDLYEYFNDINIYDTRTGEWHSPKVISKPIERTQHAFVYRKATNSLLALYGFSNNSPLSDILECEMTNSLLGWEWKNKSTIGDIPKAICGHTVVYHEKSDSIILFGGGFQGIYQNIVYTLDLKRNIWTSNQKLKKKTKYLSEHDIELKSPYNENCEELNTQENIILEIEFQEINENMSQEMINDSRDNYILENNLIIQNTSITENSNDENLSNSQQFLFLEENEIYMNCSQNLDNSQLNNNNSVVPSPRGRHTAVIYNDNEMIIFGGYLGKNNTSECWKYYIDENKWELIQSCGDIPSPRSNHDAILIHNFMYIYGGDTQGPNTLHYLDLLTNIWTKIDNLVVPQRWGHTFNYIVHQSSIRFYIIAGCNNNENTIQLLQNMEILDITLPRRLYNELKMKEQIKLDTKFCDCIIVTKDSDEEDLSDLKNTSLKYQDYPLNDLINHKKRKRENSKFEIYSNKTICLSNDF